MVGGFVRKLELELQLGCPCLCKSLMFRPVSRLTCTCRALCSGYVGSQCTYVCQLEPCANNATCLVDASDPRGYSCRCQSALNYGEKAAGMFRSLNGHSRLLLRRKIIIDQVQVHGVTVHGSDSILTMWQLGLRGSGSCLQNSTSFLISLNWI